MGLALGIGELVIAIEEDDPEFLDETVAEFALMNEVLADHGIPPHLEPRDFVIPEPRCPIASFPYSYLHALRRIAARSLATNAPSAPTAIVDLDEQLNAMTMPSCHLLYHSDCEGYYLPIDFPTAVTDERLRGGIVGSSVRLLAELRCVAPHLGIELENGVLNAEAEELLVNELLATDSNELTEAKTAWFALFDAAEQSLRFKSAILLG